MDILYKPVITEKSIRDVQHGIFTFAVDPVKTKKEIRSEVESLFHVHVKKIETVIRKGKEKHAGRQRRVVTRPSVKIARLKLAKGEKIDLFETGKAL